MYFRTILSVAVLAASAMAQLMFTSVPTSVQAGQQYTIQWSGGDATQPVTILLRKGESGNLGTVGTLTSTGTGGSFTWTVDSTITDGTDYAFEIKQGTSNNYSGLFAVSGGTGTALPTASATAKASATSADASSTDSAATSTSATDSSATTTTLATSASATKAVTSASSVPTKSVTAPSSGASGLKSPVALIMGAVVAMLYFH
ncbi:hypothetical protein EJ06DRAFT_584517 [Trichodelitschia bisporula]|uniref:Yeast cell wall synthesis Kre9/Knh1-like N-terminal domain-containing protein n=1 Tax=Trichodelitschia bisporula TaxID=703511 RepID=A0A6G1HP33_9PEZI|nr:hypothetical protein EJ06DRAFT_584517 [Trichodelitschia bisporula]